MGKTIWLRHETKPFEKRCVLTPSACESLRDLGHEVIVERSNSRIFEDSEFESLGFKMVNSNSWINDAPKEAIIAGLKELEEKDFPLEHTHIHFAHIYKGQNGSKEMFDRYHRGGGKLIDLEFLTNDEDRRIAAFGVWAGFVGAGLGVNTWAHKEKGSCYNKHVPLKESPSSSDFVKSIKENLKGLERRPRALVIGARGRCGKGATDLLEKVGIEVTGWNREQTKSNAPLKDILDFDILVNCALMMEKRAPFLDEKTLELQRSLSVISDVSCDPTGPCNPLPIYNEGTTMDRPVINLDFNGPLAITAIDHLPSLLPRESSEDFCEQFLPHFIEFLNKDEHAPFNRANSLFEKVKATYVD